MRITAIALLTAVLAGCDGSSCVSSAQAKKWTEVARESEAAGRVYEAWHAYKSIGVLPACGFDPQQRKIANEQRGRLRTEINFAYKATENAIHAFRQANGRLPTSLDEIASDIPESARRAFPGFRYRPGNETFVLDGDAN